MDNLSPSRKQKELTELPTIAQYLKTLPINLPEELVNVINGLAPINETFKANLSTLTVYRANLGFEVEKNWINMLNYSRRLIWQLDIITKRKEREHKDTVDFMAKEREKMDDEIRELRDRLNTMTTLKELQQGEAEEALVEIDTLKKEISEIHNIVQKDMDKVMQYMIVLDKSKRTDVSNQIFSCIQRLALSLNRLEDQSTTSGTNLKRMEQVIKAMARNNKVDAFTQLEESELESKAQRIFPQKREKVPIDLAEVSSLNFSGELSKELTNKHILDQLRIKEYEYPPEAVSKKNPEKSWVLPPSIVVFLQNMAKENQNGKVLPWQHVKKLIYQIYSQRISHKKQILAGLLGNAVPMDQFIVMLFIRKYNMRRLAQLKLLEFLISIKYYTKFWNKAQMFAAVLDIMRINPYFEINDTNLYKFDIYVQHFFFHMLSVFDKNDLSEEEDGSTYIEFETLKLRLKPLLCFCEELNRSRLFAKLEKTIRVQDKVEYVDFDLALSLSVEQFFYHRKHHLSEVSKEFNRAHQLCEGYFSVKQIASVFDEFEGKFKKGEEVYGCRYPASSGLQICKLYMYAVSSGKNGFSISNKQFQAACQRFGFDCPVPFLHECNPNVKKRSRLEKSLSLSPRKPLSQQFNTESRGSILIQQTNNPSLVRMESLPTEPKAPRENPYNKRIEIGTFMFSQHFSLLKQLEEYCQMFKSQMAKETDMYVLWNEFENILKVLDKGCEYLKYPLKH